MLPVKRSAEDLKATDNFLRQWNERYPKFNIISEDILKPKPMFFIMAILQLFDELGFDATAIVEAPLEECQDSECADSLGELLPILNLTEALNTLFSCLTFSEHTKFTPFNLLQPIHGPTLNCLRFLLNYAIFIYQREEECEQEIEQINVEVRRLEGLKEEVEGLKDDLNNFYAEKADRDQRIRQLEEKIERLKIEPIELSEIIEKLRSDLCTAQEQGTQLLDTQESLHKQQGELQNQIYRLRSCIVSKVEQAEVLKSKECAVQKEEEASKTKQEVVAHLHERDSAIRRLTSNMTFIRDTQSELHSLQTMYSKIQEVEKSNSGWCEGEIELSEIRGSCEELQRRIEEIRAADRAWEEDNRKAEMEVSKELETALRDDKLSESEYETCLSKSSLQRELVEKLKMASVQHSREREHYINLYTKEIPQLFEADIDTRVDHIKNIISSTLGKKLSK